MKCHISAKGVSYDFILAESYDRLSVSSPDRASPKKVAAKLFILRAIVAVSFAPVWSEPGQALP